MSANKDAKVEKVAEIKANLEKAGSFVLVGYEGLTVADDTDLRNKFRSAGASYHVYKNRLLKIALDELGIKGFDEALNGATAIALAPMETVSAPAKVAIAKSKETDKLVIKCGYVDGPFLDAKGCETLAKLPSKEGLISQIMGLLQAPVASFARVVSAIAEKQAQYYKKHSLKRRI